ncbi:MAG TPA: diguanylate cyclase [Marinobacter sp.]|nr:diguanylate cyclase [Marinobacter sp.]
MLRYRDFFPMAASTTKTAGLGKGFQFGDNLPLGILITNTDGECLYSNIAYQKLCGKSAHALIGSHWSEVIHPEDRDMAIRQWRAAVSGNDSFLYEVRLTSANGDIVWIRRNAALMTDQIPGDGYVHTIEDISTYKIHEQARVDAEEALFEAEQRAQVTLDSIGDAVLSTDTEGQVSYMNAVAETLTGFNRKEAVGRPLNEIFNVVDAKTHKPITDPARRAIETASIVALEANALLITKEGGRLAIEDSAAPIHNRHGVIIGAVIVFRDVQFSRETASRMAYLAHHDDLTGLHNRNAFYERFKQSEALAQRHKKYMGLLFIDLDNFKDTNDMFGHDYGDAILTKLADRLRTYVRATDTICRYGGDEFVILLSEIDQPGHAFAIADKIREAASKPIVIDDHDLVLKLSIGVSVYPEDGETADELLRKADVAMYLIKKMNRQSVIRNPVKISENRNDWPTGWDRRRSGARPPS